MNPYQLNPTKLSTLVRKSSGLPQLKSLFNGLKSDLMESEIMKLVDYGKSLELVSPLRSRNLSLVNPKAPYLHNLLDPMVKYD